MNPVPGECAVIVAALTLITCAHSAAPVPSSGAKRGTAGSDGPLDLYDAMPGDPCGPAAENSVVSVTSKGAQVERKIRDLGLPGPNVQVLRAEAFFRRWPAICGAPECTVTFPEDLRVSEYQKRVRIEDPSLVQRLWKDYALTRSSSVHSYEGCADDAKLMVVFCTSEPTERWLAAGSAGACGPLMVTDDYKLHVKNGPVIRDIAEAIGVKDELEKEMPDLWQ